ncbi:MAG TPA: glycosyltransferase [Verrucomicrobiae bacterium]|jgi:hypothetical protein|nr:glycosyltransferase [Verrucomicrobiae bacterium]
MEFGQVIQLPERTIGRSGRDLFLSHKDITIIMAPYERHSVFTKAIDELYRHISIPFNLIVVEGNAPEEIRLQLEKRQRQHGNMTIIYTNHYPSLGNAFNLAVPHFKTPYALFIDNEVRLPKGTVESLIKTAQEREAMVVYPNDGLIGRQIVTFGAEGERVVRSVKTFGLRPCFLLAHEAVSRMEKLFEEPSSPYTVGVDLTYKLGLKGLEALEDKSAKIEMRVEGPVKAVDMPFYRTQWNRERLGHALDHLGTKWGIELAEDPVYETFLTQKFEEAQKPVGFEILASRFALGVRNGSRRFQNAVTVLRSVGSKPSYASKSA